MISSANVGSVPTSNVSTQTNKAKESSETQGGGFSSIFSILTSVSEIDSTIEKSVSLNLSADKAKKDEILNEDISKKIASLVDSLSKDGKPVKLSDLSYEEISDLQEDVEEIFSLINETGMVSQENSEKILQLFPTFIEIASVNISNDTLSNEIPLTVDSSEEVTPVVYKNQSKDNQLSSQQSTDSEEEIFSTVLLQQMSTQISQENNNQQSEARTEARIENDTTELLHTNQIDESSFVLHEVSEVSEVSETSKSNTLISLSANASIENRVDALLKQLQSADGEALPKDIQDIISKIVQEINGSTSNQESNQLSDDVILPVNQENSIDLKSIDMEKISALLAQLKELTNGNAAQNAQNENSLQVSESSVTLIEQSIQVISKLSISQESAINPNSVQVSDNKGLKDSVDDVRATIKEIKLEIAQVKLSIETKNMDVVGDQMVSIDKSLSSLLEKLQVLSSKGVTIEESLKVEIEKLTVIKENYSSQIADSKLFVNQNGSVVNKLVSQYEFFVNKVISSQKRETTVTTTSKRFSYTTIDSKSLTTRDILPVDGKIDNDILKVFQLSSKSNDATDENFDNLIKNIDLKISLEEKFSLPKTLEAKYQSPQQRADILRQVENSFKSTLVNVKNGETRKMVINLNPRALGNIKVDIEMKDNNLSAKFKVDNEVVKELLSDSSSKLKEMLANVGINIVNMNVDVNDRNGETFKESQKHERKGFSDNKRGTSDEKDREEERRDQKRHNDSEYEIII